MNFLLVLVVIANMLGAGVLQLRSAGQKEAKIASARADIKAWEINLIRYKTRHGFVPTQAQGLQAMVAKPATGPVPNDGWTQFAKPQYLLDPWGHPYRYRNPGTHNPESYDVYSLGPDGIEGTADDIGNW